MMQPRDQLTANEIRVATLVWEGLTNREIAKIIGTTEQVVKNYLRTAFDKLGVWSRLELALYVANHGGASWASSPADVKPQAEAEPQAAAWPTPSGSTRSGQGWVVEPTGGLENEGKDFTTKGTKAHEGNQETVIFTHARIHLTTFPTLL